MTAMCQSMSTTVQPEMTWDPPVPAASPSEPPLVTTTPWEQIFRSTYPRLWAYAAHHVGRNAADDVVSETMTRAVNGISGFRWNADGIDPWLFGIARRVVADHHRRAGRLRRWSRAVAAPAVALPADVVELADEHATVRAAFNRLSADDREILELRVIAGLSPEQTAPCSANARDDSHCTISGVGPPAQAIGTE